MAAAHTLLMPEVQQQFVSGGRRSNGRFRGNIMVSTLPTKPEHSTLHRLLCFCSRVWRLKSISKKRARAVIHFPQQRPVGTLCFPQRPRGGSTEPHGGRGDLVIKVLIQDSGVHCRKLEWTPSRIPFLSGLKFQHSKNAGGAPP